MAADAPDRWWRLDARPVDGLPLPGWRWLLPGVGGALAWLRRLGLPPGARLGLAGGSSPAMCALLQAAPLDGLSVVLINRRLAPAQARRQAQDATLARLVAEGGHPLAESADALLPEDFAPAEPAWRPAGAVLEADPALVLFTSGTSGEPKAARLGFDAVTRHAQAACARLGLSSASVWLGCLPLDHIGGASLAFRAAVSGQTLLLCSRFDAAALTPLLAQATGASLVPTMLHRLLAERGGAPWPSSLRALLVGGGPLGDALCQRSQAAGLEPLQTYGLTEAGSQVCTPAPGRAVRGRTGPVLDGLALALRREDGSPAAPGEVGTIWLRGATLFRGYERQGALTEPHEAGQWFATGDLGDLDDRGSLRVHCRRTDLILSGGENISPLAVEAVLEAHPGVCEAGVCALPDGEWGQVVAAVVVLRSEPGPSTAELAAWVAGRLGPFQRPRQWRTVAQLPRTPGGKLRRQELLRYFDMP